MSSDGAQAGTGDLWVANYSPAVSGRNAILALGNTSFEYNGEKKYITRVKCTVYGKIKCNCEHAGR